MGWGFFAHSGNEKEAGRRHGDRLPESRRHWWLEEVVNRELKSSLVWRAVLLVEHTEVVGVVPRVPIGKSLEVAGAVGDLVVQCELVATAELTERMVEPVKGLDTELRMLVAPDMEVLVQRHVTVEVRHHGVRLRNRSILPDLRRSKAGVL